MRLVLMMSAALLASTFVSTAAHAKRGSCKKDERRVTSGTPVLGGPGLGYETLRIVGKNDCFTVLKTTEDGSFALLLLEKNKVGWVATGLVDAALSEGAKAKAIPVEGEAADKRYALRETPLRKTPRFEGNALGIVPVGGELVVTGKSPDGLWIYVRYAGKKTSRDNVEGWMPRYQATVTPIKPGAEPDAGDGTWSVRDEDRTTTMSSVREAPLPEPPLPELVPIGRGQEAQIWVPIGQWKQRYASDAQNDPFFNYEIESFGGGLAGGYTWRGDLPLVVDSRAGFNVWGFTAAAPGAQPVDIGVLALDLSAKVGTPVVRSDDVDVEAGFGFGMLSFFVGDLIDVNNQPVDAFTPGVYLDVHPYVAARARVRRGQLGMLSVEASLPVGGYIMLDDPGNLDPIDRQQFVDAPPPFVDPQIVAEPPLASTIDLSLGLDILARYQFPVADNVFLEAGGIARVRQAFISGLGKRAVGVYSEANNVDLVLEGFVGMSFGF